MKYKYNCVLRPIYPSIEFYVCSKKEAKEKTREGWLISKLEKLNLKPKPKTKWPLTKEKQVILINENKFAFDSILAVHVTPKQKAKILKDKCFIYSLDDL